MTSPCSVEQTLSVMVTFIVEEGELTMGQGAKHCGYLHPACVCHE